MCALHHGRWTLVPCLELVFLSLLVSSVVSLCWGWTWGATLAWSGTPTGVYLYMLVLVPGLMMVTVVDVSCPLLDTWKSSLFDCQIMEEARLGKKGRAAFAIINTRAYIHTIHGHQVTGSNWGASSRAGLHAVIYLQGMKPFYGLLIRRNATDGLVYRMVSPRFRPTGPDRSLGPAPGHDRVASWL